MPVFQKRKPRKQNPKCALPYFPCVAARMLRVMPCASGAQFNKTQTQDAFGLLSVWERIFININQLLRSYVRITLRSGYA